MIAVIYKDIMTLKKNALFTVLSCVAAYIYGLYSNNIFAISFICILMPLILMIAIFDYDSKSKFCQFAFSAPVKRRDYIIGKLFFSFIFSILGAVSNFIFLLSSNTSIENTVIFTILTMLGTFVFPSILIPLIIKLGIEKARMIMIVFINVLTISSVTVLKGIFRENNNIAKLFENIPANIIGLALIAFCTILIVVLLKISMYVINNKDY